MQAPVKYDADGIEVWCITDGEKTFDVEVFPDVDDATRARRLADADLSEIETNFNCYLLRHPDGALDLVDAGCGSLFGPVGGHLFPALEGMGVKPADIRNLIFTHLHGDHCGGAVEDGQAVFPNAQVYVHPADIAHFGDGGPGAAVLKAYAGRVHEFADGDALPGGLTVWALPGHTPGHCGFRIGSDFALVADIAHSAALQLPDPEIGPIYDVDPALAAQSRRAALEELARRGMAWSGSHLIAPHKFLRAQAAGSGFTTSPA